MFLLSSVQLQVLSEFCLYISAMYSSVIYSVSHQEAAQNQSFRSIKHFEAFRHKLLSLSFLLLQFPPLLLLLLFLMFRPFLFLKVLCLLHFHADLQPMCGKNNQWVNVTYAADFFSQDAVSCLVSTNHS